MQDFQDAGLHRVHPVDMHAIPVSDGYLSNGTTPRTHEMRRRVLVFFGVFLVCAAASLAYTFVRQAIYLADARVQVTPSDIGPSQAASAARDASQGFLVELQVLNSRPLLEKVVRRMAGKAEVINLDEQVQNLQQKLTVNPVSGTNVVQLEARSPDRLEAARIVNTVIEVYREQQTTTGDDALQGQLRDARAAVKVMDERVAARKKAVEEFRIRSNIMSAERDENSTLSRLKGLGQSLNTATEKEAIAEGKIRALEQAIADGKRGTNSKDNPTVAGMETRLSQWREDYRALERQFTPQYLDMDPNAKGLRMRITNLEQQIEVEREKGQQSALSAAREELTTARAASQRLQQQLGEDRQNVQGFTRRFADFKAMEEELQGLAQMQQAARQRLITLEATGTERKPRTLVVEPAAIPETPWRPLYAQDAAISVAGSLALAFFAVFFVEFFNRTEPVPAGPSTVIIPQPWMQHGYAPGMALGVRPAAQALSHRAHPEQEIGLLARPMPRELAQGEVQQLLAATSPEHLLVLVCLLCGLSGQEIVALKVSDLSTEADGAGILKVPGDSARTLPLVGPLSGLYAAADPAAQDLPLIPVASGRPMQVDDIEAIVTSSAFDGRLEQPQSITPESLRHTYVAFLVRQGLRFSDLSRIVGRMSAETLNALAPLAPAGERRGMTDVTRVMPAVQALADGGSAAV